MGLKSVFVCVVCCKVCGMSQNWQPNRTSWIHHELHNTIKSCVKTLNVASAVNQTDWTPSVRRWQWSLQFTNSFWNNSPKLKEESSALSELLTRNWTSAYEKNQNSPRLAQRSIDANEAIEAARPIQKASLGIFHARMFSTFELAHLRCPQNDLSCRKHKLHFLS